MTLLTQISSAPLAIKAAARTAHRLVLGWKIWCDQRQNRVALQQMTDHQLRDIGLQRGPTGRCYRGI